MLGNLEDAVNTGSIKNMEILSGLNKNSDEKIDVKENIKISRSFNKNHQRYARITKKLGNRDRKITYKTITRHLFHYG